MIQFLLLVLSAMLGFFAALLVFPPNKEYHRFMVHQLNNADLFYDRVYSHMR